MRLQDLLSPWVALDSEIDISGLALDSRRVQPGDLFFAYPGEASDGRLYMEDAARCARAIVYDPIDWVTPLPSQLPCIAFPHLARFRGEVASRFYGYPAQALLVTGVTGTNGKTTIAYQLTQAHTLLGKLAVYIGTLGVGRVDNFKSLHVTTPDPFTLQQILATAVTQAVACVCMEVSSHALVQDRVAGITFKQAIFTNLTHDHLDYHHTLKAYAEAKALLFRVPTLEWAIINADDSYASLMIEHLPLHCRSLRYGMSDTCDVWAGKVQMDLTGSSFEVHTPWGKLAVHVKSIGQFNLYNSLAVISSLLAAGYNRDAVTAVMPMLKPSPGRMEIVTSNPCVVVDYAHTPDALEKALETLNHLKKRQLIVVFGCGGDRDKAKRPIMGGIAASFADKVILTSDNPRTEDSQTILQEIARDIPKSLVVSVIEDRKQAIHHALEHAHPNDIILIAGKGHEDYQEIGKTRTPFSDQGVVRDFYLK